MKRLRIHYLQHVAFEGLGCIEDWVRKKGHQLSVTRLYLHESFPATEEFDWLIILGGPMGVHEDKNYPWLKTETRFIRQAIDEKKVVLGICLGAQLIATSLGAGVTKGRKEIGWFPIRKSGDGKEATILADMPKEIMVFHWHGDMFEIPEGAVRIAESLACSNQAFIYKEKVLGLQFHFEASPATVEEMLRYGKKELEPRSPYIQSFEEIKRGLISCPAANRLMFIILDKLVEPLPINTQ